MRTAKHSVRSRILVIGPTPPPHHGVAISTELILESSAFRHFRMLHLDTSDRRGIANIGAFELGNIGLGLRHFCQFLAIVARHRPRLVYLPISQGTGGYLRDLLFLLPAIWLRIPIVAHLRGSEFQGYYRTTSKPMQVLIRYSMRRVRRMVVLGESLRNIFDGLVAPKRIVVVPNGSIDFTSSISRVDKGPDSRADEHIMGLFLSNLRPRKGLFIALEAAIEALRRFPQLEFTFAGAWEAEADKQRTADMLRTCDVADRIYFVGTVTGEEKHRLLLSSHFLVFPPIEPEGHPRVVLEAMAASLPVITTRQGALVETVVDGETGFLVQSGDVDEVVEKISYLVENSEARRCIAQRARERFLEEYTAEVSNERLAAVFEDVLREA